MIEDKKEHEEFIEFPLDEEPSKWKKFFTIIISIFLIFLIISYVWMSYGLGDILASLIESKTLEENKIRIDDNSYLIFEQGSYEILLQNYLENQDKEFKACLIGKVKNGDYEVNDVIIPEMTEQSFAHVTSKSCPEGTIMDLHSQPYRRCIASEQDLETKKIIQSLYPERLAVIICEKDRFNFY